MGKGMLQFEENYFEGEEIEGFYVEPMMKRVWAAQLAMLQMVDDICASHNIQYFADWGTLLGAVRHKGYIPWDDDVDICMLRGDYEYFLKIAEKELPSYCNIKNANTDEDWKGEFSRVVNSHDVPYVPMEKELERQFFDCPYCVGIDIFPVDYLPTDAEELDLQLELFRAAYGLSHDIRKEGALTDEMAEQVKLIGELCNVSFTGDKPIQQQLQILSDRIAAMYMDTGVQAKECTQMIALANKPEFKIPAECFRGTVRMPFENITISVPVGYEEILKVYYGEDYMTPKQGGADHEYPFYKKQQKHLIDYYERNNLPLPEYLTEE